MRRSWDSRTFSRRLAAIGLLAGPLLWFADALIDPAWDEESAVHLAEVARSRGANITAEVVATVGSLVLIPGVLGVMRLMRGRRLTLGQVAAGLLTIGLIGDVGSVIYNAEDVAMADFANRPVIADFRDEFRESGLAKAYWFTFFFTGIVIGSLLLAVSLFRRRVVPIWSPMLLIVAITVWWVENDDRILNPLALLLLTVAFAPLAIRIWRLSDDDWEQWVIALDRKPGPPPAVVPSDDEVEKFSGD